uniref:Uncharacterized protein n=1 Tax=Onchocerca volvulus TaxID=6282 RepID=A0A8R1XWV5_ONCVO
MNTFFGYQFLLIMLLSSFTTFAQYFPDTVMNFGNTRNIENAINAAKQRQQHYPLIPNWEAIDEAKINNINFPIDYVEKGMIMREPFYSTLPENGIRKRVASGQANDKESFARYYDAAVDIDADNEYDKQTPFPLLVLKGARRFGK